MPKMLGDTRKDSFKSRLSTAHPFSRGFTLVELAIVLMIIGLLIGGILRGQELMENARVTSTIQQVNAYQGARVIFLDSYSFNPGDMPTAMARLPGCTAANSCFNGNGNGIPGTPRATFGPNDVAAINTENTQFWKHMALTHLISGVNPAANTVEWGNSHPAAKIGGGIAMYYHTDTRDQGIYLIIQNQIAGTWATPWLGVGNNPVSPLRAEQIDRKMDDGLPETGNVMGYPADNNCKGLVNGTWQYMVRNESKDCVVGIILDGSSS